MKRTDSGNPAPQSRHRWRARVVHALRVALVAGLLLLIPSPQSALTVPAGEPPDATSVPWQAVQSGTLTIKPEANDSGLWQLVDDSGQTRGWVARTLPQASDVVGYRGPTEAAIVLSPELKIQSVGVLRSADTSEHVEAVRQQKAFFAQFIGWSWGSPPAAPQIDAVSGATLTSLAMAEGLMKRIGGDKPSLVFPDPLRLEEVRPWFEDAARLEDDGWVLDDQGNRLGRVLRTGPLADDVMGYQGPSELLLQLSKQNKVEAIQLRSSFDNEPYVGYVPVERSFWALFEGKTLQELAEFSPAEQGVEGVSGATMTSMAIADTLVTAAKTQLQREQAAVAKQRQAAIRWTPADIGCLAALAVLAMAAQGRWFSHRGIRRGWLSAMIVVIGLWSGNLISMALVAGWSAEGIAWRLAPGLTAIALMALVWPPLTKSNPYCSHLCPHGALQQLIKPSTKSRRYRHLPPRLTRQLRYLPGLTLVAAYVMLLVTPTLDLASWEPFHAYLFQIAGIGSFVLAIGTLMVSACIPMAYCRLGCPTGRLLDYLRRTARSERVQTADMIAVALLVLAVIVRIQ